MTLPPESVTVRVILASKPSWACSTNTFVPLGSLSLYSVIGSWLVFTILVITGPVVLTFQPGFTPYILNVSTRSTVLALINSQCPVVFLKRKSFSGGADRKSDVKGKSVDL